MLPLSLLSAAQNKPMLVELKNGETFNGHLVNCDNFMNITLREVYQTSADGDRFWKLKECYIRGSTIKYLRVPDTLLDQVKEEQNRAREANRNSRGGHTGPNRGGRGAPIRGSRGGGRGGPLRGEDTSSEKENVQRMRRGVVRFNLFASVYVNLPRRTRVMSPTLSYLDG
ncbi:hypothetical protein Agabi119p4_2198 [Agaricus bisporus var. burnettii]|uniref:LSM complex subunit LSM4 n=1 Tax=Agaricus bisporus var. burnettii TaxID=192524 RepID=A0A8H7KJY3_AGABI|nr:hypothetical protein Agabi119p4_2198 [Agaricus bisporus var. burnettii]